MQLLDETNVDLIEAAREIVWGELAEGVFDPYILKAVFLAGGGGSGKGFVSNVMFGTVKDMATTSFGIKSVNSDDTLTALVGQLDIQKHRPTGAMVGGAEVLGSPGLGGRGPMSLKLLGRPEFQRKGGWRDQAKALSAKRQGMFMRGRLGLIIDGTGANLAKIAKQKTMLEAAGYDTYMVFVNTTIDVALKRNEMRDRRVPPPVVIDDHAAVQRTIPKYRSMFGSKRFEEVDNSKEVSQREVTATLGPKLHRVALKFLSAPLKNPNGWAWLNAETEGMPASMKKKVTWIGKKRGR